MEEINYTQSLKDYVDLIIEKDCRSDIEKFLLNDAGFIEIDNHLMKGGVHVYFERIVQESWHNFLSFKDRVSTGIYIQVTDRSLGPDINSLIKGYLKRYKKKIDEVYPII
tara:strand:+ start:443 stop:772 length:330 start_codon:yes stop_codon:yes gene_type:complete